MGSWVRAPAGSQSSQMAAFLIQATLYKLIVSGLWNGFFCYFSNILIPFTMKTSITLLLLVLLTSQAFGERKSKKEASVDTSKVQIDSLTKVTKSLTVQLDSVNRELVKYMSVYTTIKEKVIHYNFDPTRSSFLIDSMKSSRDSLFSVQASKPLLTASADSIHMLLNSNSVLKAKIDSIKLAWEKSLVTVPSEELEKSKAISNLKQLKELLDNKVINETEYITLKKKYLSKL
jgi:hypothetical protein